MELALVIQTGTTAGTAPSAATALRAERLVDAAVACGWSGACLSVDVTAPVKRAQLEAAVAAAVAAAASARRAPAAAAAATALRVGSEGGFQARTRLTVAVDKVADAEELLGAGGMARLGVDVVAVRPTSDAAFKWACALADVDIVSLDCANRLPHSLGRAVPLRTEGLRRGPR